MNKQNVRALGIEFNKLNVIYIAWKKGLPPHLGFPYFLSQNIRQRESE